MLRENSYCEAGADNQELYSRMQKYDNVVELAVEEIYSKYSQFVDKCDLLGQAYLIVLTACTDGTTDKAYWSPGHMKAKVVRGLTSYCHKEYSYYINKNRIVASGVINVNNNDLDRSVIINDIARCMRLLPGNQRTICEQVIYDEMSFAEVGSSCGLTPYMVRQKFARSMRKVYRLSKQEMIE